MRYAVSGTVSVQLEEIEHTCLDSTKRGSLLAACYLLRATSYYYAYYAYYAYYDYYYYYYYYYY